MIVTVFAGGSTGTYTGALALPHRTGLHAVLVDQVPVGCGDGHGVPVTGDVDLAGVEALADLGLPGPPPAAKPGAPAETSMAPPNRVAVTAVAAASRRRVFVGEVTGVRCPIPAG